MKIFKSYNLTEFNSLFEIPIYRLSPEEFEEELEKELDRICMPLKEFEELFEKDAVQKYEAHRHALKLHIEYPWKFNEIVGWLLLTSDSEIFSGELFYKRGKRIVKGSTSRIDYREVAFRFDIKDSWTDKVVYNRILAELKGLNQNTLTKNRYIDTNSFETVGEYIRWNKLIVDINK